MFTTESSGIRGIIDLIIITTAPRRYDRPDRQSLPVEEEAPREEEDPQDLPSYRLKGDKLLLKSL
jgi:hypothetical protein